MMIVVVDMCDDSGGRYAGGVGNGSGNDVE